MAKRTLTYWRARWLGGEVPGYPNLEVVLRAIFEAFPTVGASAVQRADGRVVEIRHRRAAERQPLLLHCSTHEPGAQGSVVPHTRLEHPAAPLRTIPPPDGADFLTGALIALVSGDHCLICSDGPTIASLRYYLQQLVIRRGLPPAAQRLDFAAVANREMLNEIIHSGVSEIGLSTTLDELDPAQHPDHTLIDRAKARAAEALATLFEREYNLEELIGQDHANINAKLTIRLNSRKHGFIDQHAFDDTAQHVIEEEEPGIYIKLRSGSRIDHQNVKLSKRVEIDSDGTTISHVQTWNHLEEYYAELVAAGYITPNEP